ncbi:helix-turn-helix transcriptional regulator [Patiriisocius marinistellae]|nr:response regulator transcription factor [Patiriisocius marinistellae]
MRYILTKILLFQIIFSFAQNEKNYSQLIDSADFYVSTNATKALQFLDSIPTPLKNNIDGKVGEYYLLQGYAYDRINQDAKVYQSYLLSIRNAKEENDFETAGNASLEMFRYTYFVKKDSTAQKYLDDAEKFFLLSNNTLGLIDVKQMPAYMAFTKKEYDKSNKLILQNIDTYKKITDDSYYYLFANFMLASNYIHMGDLPNANKYLNELQSLKLDTTIAPYNYKSFKATLDICMSKLHLDKNQIDSTLYYLSSARKLKEYMPIISQGEYFSFSAEAYNKSGQENLSRTYLDSLKMFQEDILRDNIDASFELNKILMDTETVLQQETDKVTKSKNFNIVLVIIVVGIITLLIVLYRNYKSRSKDYTSQEQDFSQLKSKHKKLTVRTQELENYISEIKYKIKQVSSLKDESSQKNKLRDLYRNINAESSNLRSNEENHIDLLRELNDDFFNKINKAYPMLSDSELIISYYLKLGFKNKDIAFFLDKSIRAVESQRFRISKKMNLENSKLLVEHINKTY